MYRFRDARNRVLYVGKARDLRARVMSYFGRHGIADRTRAMLEKARVLDFTVTASEIEAFILENNLIKSERPRFNVLLRDDKTFPYIKITTGEEWPRVEFTRRVLDDGHAYFGPFMGQHMARRLMDIARTRFAVRTCRIEIDGKLPRPCLYYHMKACLGPCVDGLTDAVAYADAVDELKLFLTGRYGTLKLKLEEEMWRASEQEDFESAARYRDLMTIVNRLGDRQDVEMPGKADADVIASYSDGEHVTVCLLPYRVGKLVDKREFHFEGIGEVDAAEVLSTFVAQYYDSNPSIPPVIECTAQMNHDDRQLLEAYLGHLRGGRVRVNRPQRGPKARRVSLAANNARAAFELRFRAPKTRAQHLERRIGELLKIGKPVRRFDCFDISHASGKLTTASCVVWQSGRMDRKQYRSFNIRDVSGIDDFAAIAEAVTRRYRRIRDEELEQPDLVLIDGGVGQLNAAMAAMDSLGLSIPIAALAKRREEVWLDGMAEPLEPDSHDPAHLALRRARDEAHRFAVSRHRKRRKKKTLSSQLLNIPGIGSARAASLVREFGSVTGVQKASMDELCKALGPRLGKHVWRHLHEGEEA